MYKISFLGVAATYTPGQNLDPNLCTHYVYTKFSLSINNITGHINASLNKSDFSLIKALKTKNPSLKTMISLPNILDLNNSIVIKEFVKSTVEFLKNNSLDGVELLMETIPISQKANFKMVMEELRAAFNFNNFTLSGFLFFGKGIIYRLIHTVF